MFFFLLVNLQIEEPKTESILQSSPQSNSQPNFVPCEEIDMEVPAIQHETEFTMFPSSEENETETLICIRGMAKEKPIAKNLTPALSPKLLIQKTIIIVKDQPIELELSEEIELLMQDVESVAEDRKQQLKKQPTLQHDDKVRNIRPSQTQWPM